MYFDAFCAAAMGDELRETVLGGFIQKLVLPRPDSVAMEIYKNRERHQLLLTTEPAHARATLLSHRPTAQPGLVTPFGLLLRKYVLDGVVEKIEQPAGERIIALSIANRIDGNNTGVWLQAELMGRHSNLLLLDAEREVILESVKRVTRDMSSVRPILPKREYTPPPARQGLAPHRVTPDALREIASGAKASSPLWQTLLSGIAGLSPLAAREIVHRAGGDPAGSRTGNWTEWTSLAAEVRRLAALWATRDWKPCVARADGGALAYAPYELTHLAAEAALCHPETLSAAIEAYAGSMAHVVSHGQLRAQLLGALDERAGQVEGRLRSLQAQVEGAEDGQRLMEDGQLILAYAYSLPPGAEKLELEDRTIELDPMLSPSENAQKLFDGYKRRKRATEDVPALIERAQAELDMINEYRTFTDLAQGHSELAALRAEALAAGVIKESTGGPGARTPKAPPQKISTLTAPDGTQILAGKSAAQNARVLDTGSPDDWWFHAREIPGGHVVARTGGREPSPETLRLAAETAAYYSAAKESGSVEVIYTQLRHVRKIKGGGPGHVTYRNERSVKVTPRDHADGN